MTDLRLYWYGVCQQVARVLFTLFFRIRVIHRERLPARGGVLVVSNHQSYLDPILVAVGMPRPFHPMARETLFGSCRSRCSSGACTRFRSAARRPTSGRSARR